MPLRRPSHALPLLFAIFTTGAALSSAGCAETKPVPADAGPAVAVETTTVIEAEWPAHFEAGGVLQAKTVATIASRLMAPVAAVRVRPGDRVRRGQVLIELDGGNLIAGAARSSASAIEVREDAVAAAADLVTAESARSLAQATHARIAALAASRAATAQELDEAVAALAAAASRVTAAGARRRGAEAALDAAVAGQRAANADASYLTLTAPFDGVVTDRTIDPGSMAAPGHPLLVIEVPSALQLQVRLDASRAIGVTVGQQVEVRLDTDGADAPAAAGRVAEISRIDTDAHSFGVKIDVAPANGWRAGLFGRARFAGTSRRALTVPQSAVVRRGQLAFVFVAGEGVARLRAVSLGEPAGARVEVLDGLAARESVLAAPPANLIDGARISTAGGHR